MDKVIFNILTSMITWIIIEFEGMNEMDVANKFTYFKTNGMIIFQGCKFNFTIQLMYKYVPFVNGVHYMAHHTNLVIQTLSGLNLVDKIKNIFSSMYNYFAHSLKHHFETNSLI